MSFLAWRKDKGTFIRAATGNLISWSSFLSRAGVHSQAPLPALSLQGQVWGTMGGTWMELALIYTITLASVFYLKEMKSAYGKFVTKQRR